MEEGVERKAMNAWKSSLFDLKRRWNQFTYEIPLFIIAVIYPEFIFGVAVRQNLISGDLAAQKGTLSPS